VQVTPGVVTALLTTGKNQFHVTAYASKQSIRYLAPKYRLYGHQSLVTVLYLICSCVLIGICFFEDEEECTVHRSAPYTVKLRYSIGCPLPVWFQHVGGTAHTERISTEVPHRLFSDYSDINRPIRSPDLSATDLIL